MKFFVSMTATLLLAIGCVKQKSVNTELQKSATPSIEVLIELDKFDSGQDKGVFYNRKVNESNSNVMQVFKKGSQYFLIPEFVAHKKSETEKALGNWVTELEFKAVPTVQFAQQHTRNFYGTQGGKYEEFSNGNAEELSMSDVQIDFQTPSVKKVNKIEKSAQGFVVEVLSTEKLAKTSDVPLSAAVIFDFGAQLGFKVQMNAFLNVW